MKWNISTAITNEYCYLIDQSTNELNKNTTLDYIEKTLIEFTGMKPKKSDISSISVETDVEYDCDGYLWKGFKIYINIRRPSGMADIHYLITDKSHREVYILHYDHMTQL